jgi:DNA polymerase III subunit epsilon
MIRVSSSSWWTKPEPPTFLAIDFETADYGPDSACALGVVRVEQGRITAQVTRLIRPPRRRMLFTDIHGITWSMVANQPCFAELLPELLPLFEGIEFLAAHNAPFDRRVLQACCDASALGVPSSEFLCTMQLARQVWGIYPTNLPAVCARLKIPLRHHDAGSDAAACAQIVLKSLRPPPVPTFWPLRKEIS